MAINAKTNNAIKTLALTNDISNPNLLINPNFKINQRGQSTYSISPRSGYTVDRWKLWNGTVTVNSDNTITYKNVSGQASVLNQPLENPCNEECILSIYITSITGVGYIYGSDSSDKVAGIITLTKGLNFIQLSSCASVNIKLVTDTVAQCSITIKYVKLEKGTNVTQFIEPDPITELLKCQRFYFIASYPVAAMCMNNTDLTILYVECQNLKNMRTNPTTILTGNNKNTCLRYDGTATTGLSIDTSNISGNSDTGMYRIQFTRKLIPNTRNKIIAIDINDARFRFDAEIY